MGKFTRFDSSNTGEAGDTKVKLFVGQIPREYTDDDIISLFSEFGNVCDVFIHRDPNRQSKGCAFVSYTNYHHCLNAIQSLHDIIYLPRMTRPIQVKFAHCNNTEFVSSPTSFKSSSQSSTPSTPTSKGSSGSFVPPNLQGVKLFVTGLPTTYTQNELKNVFTKIIDVNDILNVYVMLNRGSGFVQVTSTEVAKKCIEHLNEKETLPGSNRTLQVKIADNDKTAAKLFIGNITPTTTKEQLQELFQEYGEIQSVDVVQKAVPQQGCAFVTFTSRECAVKAIASLNGKTQLSEKPLVVQFTETHAEKQKRHMSQNHYQQPFFPPPPVVQNYSSTVASAKGPEGANLYVGGISLNWREHDLTELFERFGKLLSVKIFQDKLTQQSKGFGFVSFQSTEAAQEAIKEMHNKQINGMRLKVSVKTESQRF